MPQLNALPLSDFLDAVADAEAGRGNDVNAHEFRNRAAEARRIANALERVRIDLQAANDQLQHVRTAAQPR